VSLTAALKSVSQGVEMVFGSAAAISAAFGYHDRVGVDVELLETVQAAILGLFSAAAEAKEDRWGAAAGALRLLLLGALLARCCKRCGLAGWGCCHPSARAAPCAAPIPPPLATLTTPHPPPPSPEAAATTAACPAPSPTCTSSA
jgi:hypothetical protein